MRGVPLDSLILAAIAVIVYIGLALAYKKELKRFFRRVVMELVVRYLAARDGRIAKRQAYIKYKWQLCHRIYPRK